LRNLSADPTAIAAMAGVPFKTFYSPYLFFSLGNQSLEENLANGGPENREWGVYDKGLYRKWL
jgi:hypothetical protein